MRKILATERMKQQYAAVMAAKQHHRQKEKEQRQKDEHDNWNYNEKFMIERSISNKAKFNRLNERNDRIYEFYSQNSPSKDGGSELGSLAGGAALGNLGDQERWKEGQINMILEKQRSRELERLEKEAGQKKMAQRRMMEEMRTQNDQLKRERMRYKLSKQLKGFKQRNILFRTDNADPSTVGGHVLVFNSPRRNAS